MRDGESKGGRELADTEEAARPQKRERREGRAEGVLHGSTKILDNV